MMLKLNDSTACLPAKTLLILSTLFLFCLSSCECTYQYGVYIKNSTGTDLKVAYKSTNDVNGTVEEEIILQDGELKRIIWTADIDTGEGCSGSSPTHCSYVAEYVNAYINETTPSTIQWCDQAITFSKTDIQQAEFTIEYTIDDF